MAKKSKTFEQVVRILEDNLTSPMSGVSPRDSDTELIIQLMQFTYSADLNSRQLGILRSMNFEAITRCRRRLQQDGKYLASANIARARRIKSCELQQVAPREAAAGLQSRIERNEWED